MFLKSHTIRVLNFVVLKFFVDEANVKYSFHGTFFPNLVILQQDKQKLQN